jgi:hypothetical protein
MAAVLFVDLAAMRDSGHADQLRRVVDNIQHSPVTDTHAPLIFVSLQLFASHGPGRVSERFQLTDYTGQNVIRQRFEFPPRGRLYLDGVTIHAAGRVSRGPL